MLSPAADSPRGRERGGPDAATLFFDEAEASISLDADDPDTAGVDMLIEVCGNGEAMLWPHVV